MSDYVVRNYGPDDISIPKELLLRAKQTTIVSWTMLWKILNACKGRAVIVYELGECLLDTGDSSE